MGRFDLRTRTGLIYPIIQGIEGTPRILNLYPTANAAYSLRLLNSFYTGSAIRVRRSSDNTELDIGFDGLSGLNTTALTAFVGLNNGFVTIWYDQSGNGQNATQTTAANQPQIVTSGVIEVQLGKPAVKFLRASNNGLVTSVVINNPFSIIAIASQDSSTFALSTRMLQGLGTNTQMVIKRGDNNSVLVNAVTILANWPSQVNNQTYLLSFLRQSTTSYLYQNNASVANSSTQTSNWGTLQISTATSSVAESFLGKISEIIIYPTNQNSNISGINSNINTYYSIY